MSESGKLTPAERKLIDQLVTLGPSVLADAGMTDADAHDFLNRVEVKVEIERQLTEFKQQDIHGALARFSARKELGKLIPTSVDVLRRALAGPVYARMDTVDPFSGESISVVRRDIQNRPIIHDPEPTLTQVKAATEVLDRIGAVGAPKLERTPPVSINIFSAKGESTQVALEFDPEAKTLEQQSLSRERIRNVIEVLRERVKSIRGSETAQKLLTSLSNDSVSKPKVVKVYKTAKKLNEGMPKGKSSVRKVRVKKPS